MQRASAYTTAEVAFLLRVPIKAVKKALDEGPVEAKLVHKPGARPVREIAWADLLYLFAVPALGEELTPKARWGSIRAETRPSGPVHEVRFRRLSVAIDDLKAEVEKRARELAQLAKRSSFRRMVRPSSRARVSRPTASLLCSLAE